MFDTPKSHQKRLLRLAPSLVQRLGAYLETLPGGDDAHRLRVESSETVRAAPDLGIRSGAVFVVPTAQATECMTTTDDDKGIPLRGDTVGGW